MPNNDQDQGPGTSDWWTFVHDHELDHDDDPEPTYATFSGPNGSGVTIYLPNGTEIQVTLGQGRNGYPHVATFLPNRDCHATPYRTFPTTKGQ